VRSFAHPSLLGFMFAILRAARLDIRLTKGSTQWSEPLSGNRAKTSEFLRTEKQRIAARPIMSRTAE
jgi:hypothetical protein